MVYEVDRDDRPQSPDQKETVWPMELWSMDQLLPLLSLSTLSLCTYCSLAARIASLLGWSLACKESRDMFARGDLTFGALVA